MKLDFAGLSDSGLVRKNNEDSFLLCREYALFAVADGMGAHDCGEVASKLAVEGMKTFFDRSADTAPQDWPCRSPGIKGRAGCRVASAVEYAHHLIVRESHSPDGDHSNMGTTTVAIHFAGGVAYVAHVGDSRCYRFCEGELRQVTRDHTLVEEIRGKVDLSPSEEAGLACFSHILTRALGGTSTGAIPVDLSSFEARPGDLFLLCSDGLTNELSQEDIGRILKDEEIPEEACRRLVQSAVEHGGKDNVTVVVVRFVEGPEKETSASSEDDLTLEFEFSNR